MSRMQFRASGGGAYGCEHVRENAGENSAATTHGRTAAITCAITAGLISNEDDWLGVSGVRAGTDCGDWQHDTFKSWQQHPAFSAVAEAFAATCGKNGSATNSRNEV